MEGYSYPSDMLDISRIRTGKLTLQKHSTDMTSIVNESVDKLRDDFKKCRSVVSKVICNESTFGHWDSMRIEQVMINLLTNAIKYGKGKPITVTVEAKKKNVRVTVSDQGIGIEVRLKEVIFNRFERAVSPNEVSGMGLGLYISKQIIESHEGKIWVESSLGLGSDFIFELPLSH